MTKVFLSRLALDLLTVALFIAALAYYWLDNLAHELIGTGMFALIIGHNIFNRRWYGTLPKPRRNTRSSITITLNLSLLMVMLALLISSLMISRNVFSYFSLNGGFTSRQVHTLAAYWALVIVSMHLGLHWPVMMNAARSVFRIRTPNPVRAVLLRLGAAAIAIHGVQSSFDMNIGSRLLLQLNLDWWDFGQGALGFFIHHASIVGLYVAIAHYALRMATRMTKYRSLGDLDRSTQKRHRA